MSSAHPRLQRVFTYSTAPSQNRPSEDKNLKIEDAAEGEDNVAEPSAISSSRPDGDSPRSPTHAEQSAHQSGVHLSLPNSGRSERRLHTNGTSMHRLRSSPDDLENEPLIPSPANGNGFTTVPINGRRASGKARQTGPGGKRASHTFKSAAGRRASGKRMTLTMHSSPIPSPGGSGNTSPHALNPTLGHRRTSSPDRAGAHAIARRRTLTKDQQPLLSDRSLSDGAGSPDSAPRTLGVEHAATDGGPASAASSSRLPDRGPTPELVLNRTAREREAAGLPGSSTTEGGGSPVLQGQSGSGSPKRLILHESPRNAIGTGAPTHPSRAMNHSIGSNASSENPASGRIGAGTTSGASSTTSSRGNTPPGPRTAASGPLHNSPPLVPRPASSHHQHSRSHDSINLPPSRPLLIHRQSDSPPRPPSNHAHREPALPSFRKPVLSPVLKSTPENEPTSPPLPFISSSATPISSLAAAGGGDTPPGVIGHTTPPGAVSSAPAPARSPGNPALSKLSVRVSV